MEKDKISNESQDIETAHNKGVSSTGLLYLFGNIRRIQELATYLTKENVNEFRPDILLAVDAALSWMPSCSKD